MNGLGRGDIDAVSRFRASLRLGDFDSHGDGDAMGEMEMVRQIWGLSGDQLLDVLGRVAVPVRPGNSLARGRLGVI